MKIYDVLEYLLQNQASGGSGGDPHVAWARIPVLGTNTSGDLIQPVHILDLRIPYNKTTGMCIYSSWEELLTNTQDVNAGFAYENGSIWIDYSNLALPTEEMITGVALACRDNTNPSSENFNPVNAFSLDVVPISIDPNEGESLDFLVKLGSVSFCLNINYMQPA